jgi:hypothetical protein
MKKILGAIFGSSKNTETVLSGIDKVFFTNEEKSDFFLKYLEATQPQNMARRLIAILVVGLWVLMILIAVLAQPWMPEWSGRVFIVLEDVVNTPFSIIIGFYFAAHLARSWQKGDK